MCCISHKTYNHNITLGNYPFYDPQRNEKKLLLHYNDSFFNRICYKKLYTHRISMFQYKTKQCSKVKYITTKHIINSNVNVGCTSEKVTRLTFAC